MFAKMENSNNQPIKNNANPRVPKLRKSEDSRKSLIIKDLDEGTDMTNTAQLQDFHL